MAPAKAPAKAPAAGRHLLQTGTGSTAGLGAGDTGALLQDPKPEDVHMLQYCVCAELPEQLSTSVGLLEFWSMSTLCTSQGSPVEKCCQPKGSLKDVCEVQLWCCSTARATHGACEGDAPPSVVFNRAID